MKKLGVDYIKEERDEQINKHGRSLSYDWKHNTKEQLVKGAIQLLTHNHPTTKPDDWDDALWAKMCAKPYKERLILAGALIAAEIDRINIEEEYQEFNKLG